MQQKQRRAKKNGIQKSLMIVIILTLAFVFLGIFEALSAYHVLSSKLSELASIAIFVLATIATVWQGFLTPSSRISAPVSSDVTDTTPTTLLPAIGTSSQKTAIEAMPTIRVAAVAAPSQKNLIEATPTIAVPAIPMTPQKPATADSDVATVRLDNKAHHSRISAAQKHVLKPIFHFNEPHLPTQDELYGRKRESITLLDRTRKGLCTSIEGPRRIGKTWLLDYLKLELGADKKFLVGTIDGTMPQCQTVAEFCARTLETFGQTAIPANVDLDMLSKFVREQKSRGTITILCIDEFEGLLNEHLGPNFFTSLRYIVQTEDLGLVIISKRPLLSLVSEHCKSSAVETSPFFNIAQPLKLGLFNLGQAEEFTEEKSAAAGWNDEEHAALLKYAQTKGGWPPLLLQLVGQTLQTDKHLATNGDPTTYRPSDPAYWSDFQRRIREQYRKVVPK